MKYTNKYNFPEAIVNAVQNDDYTKGGADYSATGIMKPPQEAALYRIVNADPDAEIVVDVADQIWMLFGTAIHSILERGYGVSTQDLLNFREQQLLHIKDAIYEKEDNTDIIDGVERIILREPPEGDTTVAKEVRLYANIAGIIISGQPDWIALKKQTIEDYKTTSVWKYMKGDFSDWERQLNIYNYLAIVNGYKVKKLFIVGIFKDWKKYETGKENYPPHPVVKIPIKMWSAIETLEYIIARIKLHEQANLINNPAELAKKLPCTPEERWQGETTWALKKAGASRAYKVFDVYEDAIKTLSEKPEYQLETREGTCKKCDEYCNVAQWCQQYKKPAINMTKTAEIIKAPQVLVVDKLLPIKLDELIPEKATTDKIIEEEFPDLQKHNDEARAVSEKFKTKIDPASLELNKLKTTDTTEMKTDQLSKHFGEIAEKAKKVVAEKAAFTTVELDSETLEPLDRSTEIKKQALKEHIDSELKEKPVDPNLNFNFDDLLSKVGL